MQRGAIIIPTRFGATRLPGKPLASIAGVPLIERVIRQAQKVERATQARLIIATDEARIEALVAALGCSVWRSEAHFANGTERCLAAAEAQSVVPDFVLNIQGDAPFFNVEAAIALIKIMQNGAADVATPVVQLSWDALDALRIAKGNTPFSGTTCVRDARGKALWFSKTIIPVIRDEAALRARAPLSPIFQHIGLYAYQMAALRQFVALPVSSYEQLEGLEQLRLLEAGMTIQTVEAAATPWPAGGIDSPADIDRAEAAIAAFGDPLDLP